MKMTIIGKFGHTVEEKTNGWARSFRSQSRLNHCRNRYQTKAKLLRSNSYHNPMNMNDPTEIQEKLICKLSELWADRLIRWFEGPDIDKAFKIAGKKPGIWKTWSYSMFIGDLRQSPELIWKLSDGITLTDIDVYNFDPNRVWFCDGSAFASTCIDQHFSQQEERPLYLFLKIKSRFDELEPFLQ